ncbi:MAG: hypothetical protein OXI91_13925 [Chloroflexota bacterium]|nr:hypothetical protein [Chloroflexota bacterium]
MTLPYLDLLDALVEARGRVPAAAQVLGVNYRTLAFCCDSREVSRRMRRALLEFRNAGGIVSGETENGHGPPDGEVAALRERVAELEDENRELRELADEQARQLEVLTRRLAALEGGRKPGDAAGVVSVEADTDADDTHGYDQANGVEQDWRPPRRRPGMPDAGVVALEEQPDEEHAFGPAALLVPEWRRLRTDSRQGTSRVDRARAAVRRWELETEMLGEYRLTLPPDTYPLDDGRRADHVLWRRDALAEARLELRRAKLARLLRRVFTLGLWRD